MLTVAQYESLSPEERESHRKKVAYANRVITNCGAVQLAIEGEDWSWLSGWLFGQFGLNVTPDWCENECRSIRKIACWSDGSWRMWWKTHLIAAGRFPVSSNPREHGRLTTELHTGFISIIETEEELAQLTDWRDSKVIPSGPTTPAIERTQTKPEPIDRVALRVVGWKD